MSVQRDPNDCGCCEGLQDRIPSPLYNRPGLREIAYRAGTYSLFKQSLLAGLSNASRPALGGLRTRADDDLSIALMDAWAVAGDVLTFYIERTAQEHYLPTATERRSVDGLVQLIGYRLQPGLAASTWLAFTLESAPDANRGFRPMPAPGVPERAPVPVATRVQSIPGPGESPQTFETVEEIEALAGWNTLEPRLTRTQIPSNGDISAWFAGVGLDVNPGDVLLFKAEDWTDTNDPSRRTQRRVVAVEPDAGAQRTLVTWGSGLSNLEDLSVPVDVYVMRQRASLFGFNAPDPRLFTSDVQDTLDDDIRRDDDENVIDWQFDDITSSTLYLDTVYSGIEPGSWIVIDHPDLDNVLAEVTNVSEESRAGYSLSNRVTQLIVDHDNADLVDFGGVNTRETNIRLDSDLLSLAEKPDPEPVYGEKIPLAHDLDPIEEPRRILVRGKLARVRASEDDPPEITIGDDAGQTLPLATLYTVLSIDTEPVNQPDKYLWTLQAGDGAEFSVLGSAASLVYQAAEEDAPLVTEDAIVVDVQPDGERATLLLDEPLRNVYDRTTVTIFGNVARSTHGETVEREVLGSGDGSKPYQQFTLRRNPLTYVRSETPGVFESTLKIWVNGVQWHEVPTLYGHGPRDRIYITRIADDGKTVVQFGDGESGARLPTGQDNVEATYRSGIGLEGEVDAGQLSLLMDRPLGVRSVTNPTEAEGATGRQEVDDARENAPRSVLTLGRIVSLQDYEDFAANSPGIAKAAAVWTWDGEQRGILITVASDDGEPVPEGELVYNDLVAAITRTGTKRVPFLVKDYRPATFRLRAGLRIDPDHQQETVLAAVRAALSERFSFAGRSFGQLVTLSEVYAAIHSVPGVVSADIDHLYRGEEARLDPYLIAEAPRNGDPPDTLAAELLTLDTTSLDDLEVLP